MKNIIDVTTNCLGTTSVTAKLKGMRKTQDFTVYPIDSAEKIVEIKLQSSTRIGYFIPSENKIKMCKPCPSGAYFHHLSFARMNNDWVITEITDEEKEFILEGIRKTSGKNVSGNGMVFVDNDLASCV